MNISKRIAAFAVVGAVMLGGVSVASSAQAAEIVGTITVTPTSGNVNTDTNFLNSIAVSVGAPVGYRSLSSTLVYQNGARVGSVSSARNTAMVSTAGTNGLDGNAAFMDRSIIPTNNFVSSRLLNDAALSTLVSGQFELRYYYFASPTAPSEATDPFVKLDMTYNATTGAWSVYTPAEASSVSLTAGATGTNVALSATVKRANATTATAAAGNILFKEGSTTVATVAVASGVASTTLSSVANGAHSYTATFVPTDATVLAGSTSASASVQVGGVSASSTVSVTLPSGVGALTLTGVSSSVALGTAVLADGTLNASGTLNAVVTDTRQLDYAGWNLTGQVSDFTTGSKTFDGKYLGWTPAATGIGSAAAAVAAAPTSANGLKTISPLSTGAPSAAGTVTNVSALLQLKAPANTPAGSYSGTLTLTLI